MIRTPSTRLLVPLALLGAGLAALWTAPETASAADARSPRHLVCQAFEVDLEAGARIETADQTQELGQWVATHEAAGWAVASTDFEVSQTATGRPRAWTHVCLERAS